MDSAELETLKLQLRDIRDWIQKYTDWRNSEPGRVKIVKYNLSLESLQNLERLLLAKIAQYHLDGEITRLKGELSSSESPPSVSRRLEERLEAARVDMAVLDDEIFQCDREIRKLPRIELPDEILMKPAAESPPYETAEESLQALAAALYDSQSQVSTNAATSDAAVFPSVPAAPESVAVQSETTQASSAILNPSAPKPTKHKGRPQAKKTKTVQPPPGLESDLKVAIWTAFRTLKNRNASTEAVADWFQEKGILFPPKGYEAEIKSNPKITTWPKLYRDCSRFRRNFQSSVTKVRKLIPKNKRFA